MRVTESIGAIGKAITAAFKYFSAEEKRARRKIAMDDRVRKAVQAQEQHYIELNNFINFVTPKITLKGKVEKREYFIFREHFKSQRDRFLKLT